MADVQIYSKTENKNKPQLIKEKKNSSTALFIA